MLERKINQQNTQREHARAQQQKRKEAERLKKQKEAQQEHARAQQQKRKEAERLKKQKEAQQEHARAQNKKQETENNIQNYCKQLASCSSKLSSTVINEKRKQVYDKMIAYADLKEEDLKNTSESIVNFSKKINSLKYNNKSFFSYLLNCYDEIFFDNKLRRNCTASNATINISWNTKMTCTGGVCRFKKSRRETRIELSSKVFNEGLKNLPENEKLSANGVECNNLLNCLQLVFEHELVHAIIYIFCIEYGRSGNVIPTSCWTGNVARGEGGHTKTFMSIVNNLFGHTGWKHDLLSYKRGRKSAEQIGKLRDALKIGDSVSFESKNGIFVYGVIKKKNPKYFKVKAQNGNTWTVHPRILVPTKSIDN